MRQLDFSGFIIDIKEYFSIFATVAALPLIVNSLLIIYKIISLSNALSVLVLFAI